uniref:Uncharacterized protein n=1 Tax=Avena sativa TaxID=4498 RepID=A0ACD5ZID9_AVESA
MQVPIGLEGDQKACLNMENIYIANTTPRFVVKLYQDQFASDLLLFLKLRYEELVFGGQMVLTFLGRKNEDVYNGDLNHLCGLLAQAVLYLVDEGLIRKEKLTSFNLPIYGPSVHEVREVVNQTKLYEISDIKLFQSNWDPYDDTEGDDVHDNIHSGMNVAQSMRAVMEPLFTSHFGDSVIDRLFKKYAQNVAEHLKRENTKYSVIALRLKKT